MAAAGTQRFKTQGFIIEFLMSIQVICYYAAGVRSSPDGVPFKKY